MEKQNSERFCINCRYCYENEVQNMEKYCKRPTNEIVGDVVSGFKPKSIYRSCKQERKEHKPFFPWSKKRDTCGPEGKYWKNFIRPSMKTTY